MVTSVRLEQIFWKMLDEIAQREQMSLNQLVISLYDEAISECGEVKNFASILRVACCVYLESSSGAFKRSSHPHPRPSPRADQGGKASAQPNERVEGGEFPSGDTRSGRLHLLPTRFR